MIIDTGPVIALIDADDRHHFRCRSLLSSLPTPLIMTVPCFAEAQYLLFRNLGFPGQQTLWKWRQEGMIQLHYANQVEEDLIEGLMTKYRDTPMDYADASVIAAAQVTKNTQILTLDQHFFAYRFSDGSAPQVIPN